MSDSKTTHFGYKQINVEDKAGKVAEVFHSVAKKYDLMNDLMSLGLHRYWKHIAINKSLARTGQRILDVAGGTGDLSALFSKKVGPTGQVIVADINASMLSIGRDRLLDQGLFKNIEWVQADAENLPFPDNYFDCITISFGLRNVTHKEAALASMTRVLKPGGQLLVLEFSTPTTTPLKKIYDAYSFNILPRLGKIIANDRDSYQYLAESIRMHPDQNTLLKMLENAGLSRCGFNNLAGGIVALHYGYKL